MITRANYEEYFLSYVDNELPAETRLAVEHFVAANPDLREELETLLQCRLEPEPGAVFPGKDSLLQYEESLLLYVDGELDEAGLRRIEELVKHEPHLGLELKQLQHTVSEPDMTIVFPGKESLYHPAKRRHVVLMPWLRAAAAAAVVAVVALLMLPHGHKTNVPAVAVVKINRAAVTPAATSPLYPVKDAPTVTPLKTSILPMTANAGKTMKSAMHGTNAFTHAMGTTRSTARPETARSAAAHPAEAHSVPPHPATASNEVASTDATTTSNPLKAMTPATSDASTALHPPAASHLTTPARDDKAAATLVAAVNIPKEQRSFATQALLQEAREEGDGDMAGNLPPATGKTKLRGLFRRVTRAIGKTADRDDDGGRQVSISVFQVALK